MPCIWFAVSLSMAQAEDVTPPDTQLAAQLVTQTEVNAAIAKLKQDPNLIANRSTRSLTWRQAPSRQDANDPVPSDWLRWLHWIRDLFLWLADVSRLLLWTVVIVLGALLVLFLIRIFKQHRASPIATHGAPTHIHELDIRPESMPDDIGAAAWQLWNSEQQRAALALLYRGLLSRLVHVYRVPIRASSTEAESLALAQSQLTGASFAYARQLSGIWQRAVYGATMPAADEVHRLCNDFAVALTLVHANAASHASNPT